MLTEPLVALRKPLSVPRTKFDANKFVLVALVVVPYVEARLVNVPTVLVRSVMVAVVARRSEEKKDVVVAFVAVAFTEVKSCSVEEPVTMMFVNVDNRPVKSAEPFQKSVPSTL